jgi:tRNA(Ile)-lysidine synthase
MLTQLRLILQQDCALGDNRPVLLGVSGGPDSLCLLDILDKLGVSLIVAHLNHRLRPEADDDARAVAQFAQARGLPFVEEQADVRAYGMVHQLSIEEAAREVRYRFLFEQARQHGVQAVAVAHTADDQVETFLMHLLRGAGLAGLRGMAYRTLPHAWSEEIPLVRPLLGVWREQVLAYCLENQLDPHFDATNLDTTFFRNRLRHELIPYLESYNPRARQLIWRTANTLSADYEAVSFLVEEAWAGCVGKQGTNYIELSAACLLGQPVAVQRMVVRQAIGFLRPQLRDLAFDVVERTLAWLAAPPKTLQCDLIAGLRMVWQAERVFLASWDADLPVDDWPTWPYQPRSLNIPGKVKLPGGWQLHLSWAGHEAWESACQNTDPYQAWFNAELGLPGLILRTRHEGDRIQPLGMEGASLKLSDYFINRKLPRLARQTWPLICAGEQIVWVPGYHLAHPFRLTENTTRAIHLALLH